MPADKPIRFGGDDDAWTRIVLSTAVAVLGGLGCWALLQRLKLKSLTPCERKRSLEADSEIMRIMKASKSTNAVQGGVAIEGYLLRCNFCAAPNNVFV